jgi:TolB protein
MYQLSPSHRRIATAITAIALALGSGLCTSACRGADASTTPEVSSFTSPTTSPAPTEAARSIAGIPGTLFYETEDGALLRRTVAGEMLPTGHDAWRLDISADGKRLAMTEDDGDVLVTDGVGQTPRRIYRGAAPDGYGPVWSPDGTTLVIGRQVTEENVRLGLLDVGTGRFTALPGLTEGLHPRFSGDGRRIAYLDDCRLLIAPVDGGAPTVVPVVGDQNRKNNPSGSYACDVLGVNTDGSRVAVDLKGADEPAGDIVGDLTADTVIDTATGAAVGLPVNGEVLAAIFRPDGSLLVRSRKGDTTRLTVLSAAGEQIAQAVEPRTLKDHHLSFWTR